MIKDNPLITVGTVSIRPKGLAIIQRSLAKQTYQNFQWEVEIGIPERGCDLSRAYNRILKRAKGKYFVSWQDYIKIPPDGLEKFLEKANDKSLYTGAVGKTLDWKDVNWDWRAHGELREIDFRHWEIDWAFGPLEAFKKVGGFEEEYDQFWSSENVEIAYRMSRWGYKFYVMSGNKAIQYNHDEVFKHPFRHKFNPIFHNAHLKEIEMGNKPTTLDYLK